MMKVVARSGALALTVACAAAGPPVPAAPNALRAPADSAAAALTRQLTSWGFTATQGDSGAFRIVSGSLRLPVARRSRDTPSATGPTAESCSG
jgi:hypothetical protein